MRGRFLSLALTVLAVIAPCAAEASTYRWQVDASGDWNDPSKWAVVEGAAGDGYPHLPGDVAVFDEPLTAPRTITIPTGVTISIGSLTVRPGLDAGQVIITRAGTGLLVFDNLGEDAMIETGGRGGETLMKTPIQLASHLVFNGAVEFSGISESVPGRNVTVTGNHMACIQPNTYTGTTTVVHGQLVALPPVPMTIVPGPLVIGDGTGAAGSANVLVMVDAISHSADVQVNADGKLDITSLFSSFDHAVDELTVSGGSVELFWAGTNLTVRNVTMEAGRVLLHPNTNIRLTGALTATSAAAGPAIVRPAESALNTALVMAPGFHDFTIADGPQAIDFVVEGVRISESGPAAGLAKRGPGVMQIGGATYTGATLSMAGELIVNGDSASSLYDVSPNAVLSGAGTIGLLAVQAGGRVSPGAGPAVGILSSSGAAQLVGTLSIQINGPTAGSGHDQLKVTGVVSLSSPTLEITGAPFLPPDAVLTIIDNDGNDAVNGTFSGLPEGATVTFGQRTFAISYAGGDGNDVVLVNTTAVTYFLSEGATGTFFDEDVLIANPNTVPAPVTMTFFLPGGGTVVHQLTVPAQARTTVKVDQIPGLDATSPSVEVRSNNRLTLAVERTMFWDSTHYGGHTANASSAAENTWYFAEGTQATTPGSFDTFLLLANANNAVAQVKVTFLLENGPPFVLTQDLPAQSRTTVYTGDHPELVGQSFGIKVEGPVTAERAMYFGTTPQRLWPGGHDNVGSPVTSTSWFHPEGASGSFFYTFLLLANPAATKANVTLKFLLADGGDPIEFPLELQPQRRLTINPATLAHPRLQNAAFSTVVTSDVPIVSERAMYWPTDDVLFGEGHVSSGLTRTALNWSLAEGRAGGPDAYTTYILLANPNPAASSVKVTFLRESGTPIVKTYDVPASSRFNIDVGTMVPELQNESFGAFIEVQTFDAPIAVERSMYWNSEGRFWSGGTNAVGTIVPR